jgi:hypothetical protein
MQLTCAQDSMPPVGGTIQIRSRATVQLGPVRIEIRSNEREFRGFRFFSAPPSPGGTVSNGGEATDFTLTLCNLSMDGPWSRQELAARRDSNYRARRMSAGYYLTDHFGAPAYLVTCGKHYWIFAEDFEPILWPYAVKYLLTLYSLEHNLLHLKAAGIAVDGRGALLVGRGGSGKTVMLSQLCSAGAQFLSNTHALVDGSNLVGIRTAMRVRPDEFFGPIIAARKLLPGVNRSEYTADPAVDLGWSSIESAPIASVCLLDYKGSGRRVIREVEPDTLFDYMEHFSFAVNVYGLKEDVLDALGGDVARFSIEMSRMRESLRTLINSSRCHYLSCDAADPMTLRAICDLLRN